MQIIKRFRQIIQITKGYFFKWKTDLTPFKKIPSLKPSPKEISQPKTIVSLTSYGRRVKNNVVYYTLVSLLKQSKHPDRIILWLDWDNWNEDNLPPKLKRLREKGIDIRFCEDLKSYKKLIPSIIQYPNDIIITVDDDVIYPKDFIGILLKNHINYPKYIISGVGTIPLIKNKENIKWTPVKTLIDNNFIMPIGYGGVLYPPNSLSKEVFKEDIYKKLCPYADDIWFYGMSLLNDTKHICLGLNSLSYTGIDIVYQFLHKGTALTHVNIDENENDRQLKNIIKYYNLILPTC